MGVAARDRDAGAGVEMRVQHQALAALAGEPGVDLALVERDRLRDEMLGRWQVAEARGRADVLALQPIEQRLLVLADVAFDQVAAGVLVRLQAAARDLVRAVFLVPPAALRLAIACSFFGPSPSRRLP